MITFLGLFFSAFLSMAEATSGSVIAVEGAGVTLEAAIEDACQNAVVKVAEEILESKVDEGLSISEVFAALGIEKNYVVKIPGFSSRSVCTVYVENKKVVDKYTTFTSTQELMGVDVEVVVSMETLNDQLHPLIIHQMKQRMDQGAKADEAEQHREQEWKAQQVTEVRLEKIQGSGYKGMLIPAGSFEMGKTCEKHGTRRCGYSDPDICFGNCPCTPEYKYTCDADEKPVHQVTITRDFYMMESEVTQGLYQSVMGNNPSKFSRCGSDCPVERVSWFDAVRFANKLSQKEGLEECYQINGNSVRWSNKSCNGWRLPTEAEWEYAGDVYFNYAGSSNADAVSWTKENSRRKTHKVCGKKRNGYELCDMSGNVNEWVWDWYGAYSNESQSDPTGVSTGSYRVYRGGSWNSNARDSRVSDRISNSPMLTNGVLGFRLGRTP